MITSYVATPGSGMSYSPFFCNMCAASCRSFAFYPSCDPYNPGIPYIPFSLAYNYVTNDFFGQFIKTNVIRRLTPDQRQRFIDRLFILCPNCNTERLGLISPDDYLICTRCNIHFDLDATRPLPHEKFVTATLQPDGTLKRRYLPILETQNLEIDFDSLPF